MLEIILSCTQEQEHAAGTHLTIVSQNIPGSGQQAAATIQTSVVRYNTSLQQKNSDNSASLFSHLGDLGYSIISDIRSQRRMAR